MRYQTIPRTDLNVSKICLGTMTWGEQNTEAEGYAQMDLAVDRGVNFFDTAELYPSPVKPRTQGDTETFIGNWLQKTGKRKDLILASKIAGDRPFAQHIRPQLGFSKTSLEEALDLSLKRLQVDHLDLYQLHWPSRQTNFFGQRDYKHDKTDEWEDNFLEILTNLDSIIKSGRVRYFGLSNETPWGMMRYLHLAETHGLPRCVSIQNPYSLLNRTFEVGLSEMSIREEVTLLPYSPLGAGMLSGKYHLKTDEPENRLNKYKHVKRYSSEQSWEATRRYLEIAQANDLTLTQMALAFVNDQPFVTSNIIGATNLQQLAENIDSIDIQLSEEVIKAINEVHAQIPNPAP
ncbi:aldo/keto reductase [Lewinella cohaerens]|uniref:aldo/keto reductase n=1 Tax=Lewinella cohaerens TaxID=70995 RepID=UPI000475A965|nr:aldo/keto reductase [Lewinella cohaerens]